MFISYIYFRTLLSSLKINIQHKPIWGYYVTIGKVIHGHIYVRRCMFACICICTCCVYVCICASVCVYIYVSMFLYINVCICMWGKYVYLFSWYVFYILVSYVFYIMLLYNIIYCEYVYICACVYICKFSPDMAFILMYFMYFTYFI